MSLETITKLATFTVTSPTNFFQFNNIPQGYTDLKLHVSARATLTNSNQGLYMQVRGANSIGYGDTIYHSLYMRGFGSSGIDVVSTATTQNAFVEFEIPNASNTTGLFSNIEIYINNYSGNTWKTILSDESREQMTAGSSTILNQKMRSAVWRNTAPITDIQFGTNLDAPNFFGGTTVTLYGIRAYNKAVLNSGWASGGTISTDSTYIYHTFSSSNMFNVNRGLKGVEVLTVAGGGSGAAGFGGGGGGGGILGTTIGDLAIGSYPVIVGAGAAATDTSNTTGRSGSNSFFHNLTQAIGGGFGQCSAAAEPAGNGGSGGGGSGSGSATTRTGGTGTAGQGNNGGTGNTTSGAGGGGAGGVGGSPGSTIGGAGGAGTSLFSAWGAATGTGLNVSGTRYYSGGGSGNGSGGMATAGLGGYTGGEIPPANSGGGSAGDNGRQGGSGVVIIRYRRA